MPRDRSPGHNPPCGAEGASRADLGSPDRANDEFEHLDFEDNYAEFTTAGGELYVTTYGQHGGGFFDTYPAIVTVAFGQGAPQWEESPYVPVNAQVTEPIFEDHYTVMNLDPGRYWATGVTGSFGGRLEIVSCEADALSDVRAVPDLTPIESSDLVPPCGEQGLSRVELGSPTYEFYNRYQDLSKHAKFSTTGGEVYVTVNGIVDSPVKDRYAPYARVLMGVTPPYQRGTSLFTAEGRNKAITEGGFTRFDDLIAGTFWVFVTPAANVTIVSCEEGGVYDARPVAPVGANGSAHGVREN